MEWIRTNANGKFHAVIKRGTVSPNQNQYLFACGRKAKGNPDKTAIRNNVYKTYLNEYCDECIERLNKNSHVVKLVAPMMITFLLKVEVFEV